MERLSDYPGIKISYEPSGYSSRLIVSLDEDIQVVNYQIEMLSNNMIENLLPMKMLQKNNLPQLHYIITSKTSIEQDIKRRKLTRNNFIDFMLGTIKALKDAEAHLMVNSGIVFDPEYIFIDPSNYSPMFLYLPIYEDDTDIKRLTGFIGELIMGNTIEDTRDNFVQQVLIAINQNPLTLDSLQESFTNLRGERPDRPKGKARPENTQPTVGPPPTVSPPPESVRQPQESVRPQPQPYRQPVPQEVREVYPGPPAPVELPTKPAKVKKPIRINKQIVIFAVLQVVVISVLAALLLAGAMYKTGTKEIDPLNIMILTFAAIGIDIIIYREMFVNKIVKDSKTEARAEKPPKPVKQKKQKVAKLSQDMPVAPMSPAMPVQQQTAVPPQSYAPQAAPVQQVSSPAQAPGYTYTPQTPPPRSSFPSSSVSPPVQRLSIYKADNDPTVETELLDLDHPYLECNVNGCVQKITLTRNPFTIGRLAGQVDYVCASKRVGRLHADFIMRDGNIYVRDCNTRNGTYINDGPQLLSNTEYQIFPKDKITLADVDFILHM